MGYLKVAVQDLHSNFISECQSTIVRVVTYIIAPIIAPTHNHYYLLQNHFISMIGKLTAGHATYSELFGHIEIVLISQPRYTRNANDENRHYLHTKRHKRRISIEIEKESKLKDLKVSENDHNSHYRADV